MFEGAALYTFDLSVGLIPGAPCISCDKIAYIVALLENFGLAIWLYWAQGFVIVMPLALLCWLAYEVIKLMVKGGEDGRDVMFRVVKRFAIFAMIWMLLTIGRASDGGALVWHVSGPGFMDFATRTADEVRTSAISIAGGSNSSGISCDIADLKAMPVAQTSDAAASSAGVACFVERSGIVALSSGLAVIENVFNVLDGKGTLAKIAYMPFAFLSMFIAIVVLAISLMSLIWLIALVLDAAFRIFLTAAFTPVIAGLWLFDISRSYAQSALKMLIGSFLKLIAIGVLSAFAFFAHTNVVNVYNDKWEAYSARFDNGAMAAIPSSNVPGSRGQPTTGNLMIDNMREYIRRASVGTGYSPDDPTVPLSPFTPWMLWSIVIVVVQYAAVKKSTAMIEAVVGNAGSTAFADAAQGMSWKGAQAGMAGMIAGAPFLARMSTQGTQKGFELGNKGMGKAVQASGFKNPFSKAAQAADQSQ